MTKNGKPLNNPFSTGSSGSEKYISNPSWITFLFPLGTFVWPDDQKPISISLEEINNNQYNGKLFQKIVTTVEFDNLDSPAFISYDGALALPVNNTFSNVSKAINQINKIEGALLLGGICLETTYHKNIECGQLSDDRKYIQSDITSQHNRLRTNSMSLSERIVLSDPNYFNVSTLKKALLIGFEVLNKIENLTPHFIVKGHTALASWNLSDALINLWISIEQLTSFIWKDKFLFKNYQSKKSIWRVSERHKMLFQANLLTFDALSALNEARIKRNKLVHKGEIPPFQVVEKLWFIILDLIESFSDVSLKSLRNNTFVSDSHDVRFNKHYLPSLVGMHSVEKVEFGARIKSREN